MLKEKIFEFIIRASGVVMMIGATVKFLFIAFDNSYIPGDSLVNYWDEYLVGVFLLLFGVLCTMMKVTGFEKA